MSVRENLLSRLRAYNPKRTDILQIFLDITTAALSFFIAMLLRLEHINFIFEPNFLLALAATIVASTLAFWAVGLYSNVLKYISTEATVMIVKGSACSGLFA